MIKCPGTLKAGPYIWRVRIDPGKAGYGETHYYRKTITFCEGIQNGEQALVTLIHEWMHVAEENSTVPDGNRMNHDTMRLLSTWIVDLLQQLGVDTSLDLSGLGEK